MLSTRRVSRKQPVRTPDGSAPAPHDAHRPGRSRIGIIVAVLGFAIAFPLVAHLSEMDDAVVTATLAALPGILYAALSRTAN